MASIKTCSDRTAASKAKGWLAKSSKLMEPTSSSCLSLSRINCTFCLIFSCSIMAIFLQQPKIVIPVELVEIDLEVAVVLNRVLYKIRKENLVPVIQKRAFAEHLVLQDQPSSRKEDNVHIVPAQNVHEVGEDRGLFSKT